MLSPHLPAELQSQPQGCLVVLLLTLCIIIFRVFDVPPPLKVGSILWEVCFLHSPLPSGFMSSQILSIQLVVCFCELFLSPTSC